MASGGYCQKSQLLSSYLLRQALPAPMIQAPAAYYKVQADIAMVDLRMDAPLDNENIATEQCDMCYRHHC